jgi:nucleoid DNA-binding protein
MLPGRATHQPVLRRLIQTQNEVKECSVYHREVIANIARRLPYRTQRDVAEVVELLAEVWSEELIKGSEIIVPEIGRLRIEVQDMRAGGALGQHGQLRRIYGRFRPTPRLKEQIQEVELE